MCGSPSYHVTSSRPAKVLVRGDGLGVGKPLLGVVRVARGPGGGGREGGKEGRRVGEAMYQTVGRFCTCTCAGEAGVGTALTCP